MERTQQRQSGAIAAIVFIIPLVWGLISFTSDSGPNSVTGESVIFGEPSEGTTVGRVGIDWITAFSEF